MLKVIAEKTYQTFNKKFKITPYNKHRLGILKVYPWSVRPMFVQVIGYFEEC